MTLISLQHLAKFLNKYKITGRIADFGGTNTIGAPIVRSMLVLKNVTIDQRASREGLGILVGGTPQKKIPKYFVLDYDNDVDLMKPIKGKKFDGGICMDLLEHTSNPFIIAENISNSLKKGAFLFVTVPWIWELHYYPKD